MKNRFDRTRLSVRTFWFLRWLGLIGIFVFLYLLIFTSQLNTSIKTSHQYHSGDTHKNTRNVNESLPKTEKQTHKETKKILKFVPLNIPDDVQVENISHAYPNMPILYWMNVKSSQHEMYLSNSSCAPFPNIYNLDIHNIYWQTIDMTNKTSVQIYSAYYDNRAISGKVVRIISMVNRTKHNFPGNKTWYCQMWFNNEKQPVIAPMDKLDYMWIDEWHSHGEGTYGPFLLGCSVPQSHQDKIPQVVSFVENPCDKAKNMLRVIYDPPSERKEFSVCVKGLDFLQVDLSSRMVEWIELILLMGVDKIYFYQLEVHPRASKVLDYYKSLGKVDVRDITLPMGHPNIPFLLHSFLLENNLMQCLDEIIPYNDCFYRNLYTHQYVALLDIDEIILPLKDNNWHDLIVRAKNYSKPDTRFHGFTAQNIYFLDRMDTEYPHKDIPQYMHMLQHVYRAQNFTPWGFYVKTIFNTDETRSCHNHWPITVADGSISHSFSYEDARMQHYRKKCAWEIKCEDYDRNPVKDTRMWDFKDALIPRVKEAMQKIGLLQESESDDPNVT